MIVENGRSEFIEGLSRETKMGVEKDEIGSCQVRVVSLVSFGKFLIRSSTVRR